MVNVQLKLYNINSNVPPKNKINKHQKENPVLDR